MSGTSKLLISPECWMQAATTFLLLELWDVRV